MALHLSIATFKLKLSSIAYISATTPSRNLRKLLPRWKLELVQPMPRWMNGFRFVFLWSFLGLRFLSFYILMMLEIDWGLFYGLIWWPANALLSWLCRVLHSPSRRLTNQRRRSEVVFHGYNVYKEV